MRPVKALFIVASFAGLAACSGSHDAPYDRAAAPAAAKPAEGLNVPSLLALSIDEIAQRVGPRLPMPADFADPVLIPLIQRHERIDSAAFFRSRGLAIVASYDHHTRRVNDLLLLGPNENGLMTRAQLQLGADRYLVLPVFQERHPTKLLGLRVLSVALSQ